MKKSTVFICGLFAAFMFTAIFMNKIQAQSTSSVDSPAYKALTLLRSHSPAILCSDNNEDPNNTLNNALGYLSSNLPLGFEITNVTSSDKVVCMSLKPGH
jgi:hypothetical protein